MSHPMISLALAASGAVAILLALALVLSWYSRRRRRRLLGRQTAADLRRAAEHTHLVALACQRHTGNAEIGRTLQQHAIRMLEEALRHHRRDRESRRLLQEYESPESANGARLSAHAGLEEDEVTLSRSRMLLTEALRLLSQIERAGAAEPDALRHMRDNIHQARRAIELRLRLRHAAQTPALGREHVYQSGSA